MTTQEKLQAVKKAIQEACPDLMKLKFGCYFSGNGYSNGRILRVHENHPFFFVATVMRGEYRVDEEIDFDKALITIHGSPITLCHILRWLEWVDTKYDKAFLMECRSNGTISGVIVGLYGFYNLKQDTLDQQSPEFIEFLYSFLPTV